MLITAISDTHMHHKSLKGLEGDLIIFAGDATGQGLHSEITKMLQWYAKLPFEHKIFVPGNHDHGFEDNPAGYKQLCTDLGIKLLVHESTEINGIKIFGSPWTPYFNDWAFNAGATIIEAAHYRKPFIGDLWATIPADTNILVTHGPPYDILDLCADGRHVGCQELRKVVETIKPDLHFFGHIHHSAGQKHQNGTSFYNACVCDEKYRPTNLPIIVEYKK